MQPNPHSTLKNTTVPQHLKDRYLEALLEGDRSKAMTTVDDGLALGLSSANMLLEVFAPAQFQIGELWHQGEITISQEHWGTQVTQEATENVIKLRPPRRSLNRKVLVTTVPGEIHTLPARMVAGLFSCQGWTVDFLGAAPPAEDIIQYIDQRKPDLVALSVTLTAHRESAANLCQAIQELRAHPPTLVGGEGTTGLQASLLNADALTQNALEGLKVGAGLTGLNLDHSPGSYLKLIGQRIRKVRRSTRMNQSQLAESSGLTRPYLSAVEGGKQNISLEAAFKIASALGISMGELLDDQA